MNWENKNFEQINHFFKNCWKQKWIMSFPKLLSRLHQTTMADDLPTGSYITNLGAEYIILGKYKQ